ncbi:MAG: hypothetical protein OXI76_03415 [Gemmatimonadota bacterium]|nr:hypothetical protein [Gemmatimonadota bacterium]
MNKLKRVRTAGKVGERAVALPGTMDDIKAWKGVIVGGVGTGALWVEKVRGWFMDSLASELVPAVLTVLLIVFTVIRVSAYRRKKEEQARREELCRELTQWLERRTYRIAKYSADTETDRESYHDYARVRMPPLGWVFRKDAEDIIRTGARELLEGFRRQHPDGCRFEADAAHIDRELLLQWLAR